MHMLTMQLVIKDVADKECKVVKSLLSIRATLLTYFWNEMTVYKSVKFSK